MEFDELKKNKAFPSPDGGVTYADVYEKVQKYGFNGGGQPGHYSRIQTGVNSTTGELTYSSEHGSSGYAGGGATHIALKKGLQSEQEDDRSSVILVAGGSGGMTGGGAYKTSKTKCYERLGTPGAGGGWGPQAVESDTNGHAGAWHYPLKNEDARLNPYISDVIATMTSGYAFGVGEDGENGNSSFTDIQGCSNGRGGGGGGWYGGFSAKTSIVEKLPNGGTRIQADPNYYGGSGGSAYGNPQFVFYSDDYPNSRLSGSSGSHVGDGRVLIYLEEEIPLATIKSEKDPPFYVGGSLFSGNDFQFTVNYPSHSFGGTVILECELRLLNEFEDESIELIGSSELDDLWDERFNNGETQSIGFSASCPSSWKDMVLTSSSMARCVVRTKIRTMEGIKVVGENAYDFEVRYPDYLQGQKAIPYVSNVEYERIDPLNMPEGWNVCIQNICGYRFSISAGGFNGSSIVRYEYQNTMEISDDEWQETEPVFLIDPVTSTCNIFHFRVIDTRDRISNPFTVYTPPIVPYALPYIDNIQYKRSHSDGSLEDLATYCVLSFDMHYSSCNGQNEAHAYVSYRPFRTETEGWTVVGEYDFSASAMIFGDGLLSTDKSYEIRIQCQDKFHSFERILILDSSLYLIHFKDGGNAVGFGIPATKENAINLSEKWTLYHGDTDVLAKIDEIESRIKSVEGSTLCHYFRTTLPLSGWVASIDGTLSQRINVEGMTDANGSVDLDLTDITSSQYQDISQSWSCVSKVETSKNQIIATCYEGTPYADIPLFIKIEETNLNKISEE